MAIQNINLQTLFSQNFFVSQSGKIEIKDPDGSKNLLITQAGKIEIKDSDGSDGSGKVIGLVNRKSQAGSYGNYYGYDKMGRQVFMPLTINNLFLPYCWITVKGNKRIVETPLTERRGMVREFIAMDDYTFSVQGFVIGQDGRFPEKDVEELRKLFELNKAVEAHSVLTDMFMLTKEQGGQNTVVMYDLEITSNQAIEHVRGYQFELKTDQQFELELIN